VAPLRGPVSPAA